MMQPEWVDARVEGDLIVYDVLRVRRYRRFWQTRKRGSIRLFAPLVFIATGGDGQEWWWDAPQHMETDGYSYPITARWRGGRNPPAVAHDRLYVSPILWNVETGKPLLATRETADKLFQLLMVKNDFPPLSVSIHHFGVSIGGWVGWNRERKKNKHLRGPRPWKARPRVKYVQAPAESIQ